MNLELTKEEALVLSDWLHRLSKKAEPFDDVEAKYVFWSIENQLEKALDEPHSEHYLEILAQARKTVVETYGG